MKMLRELTEDFIRRSTVSTVPAHTPPISPKDNPANLAVMSDRWRHQKTLDGGQLLSKVYRFRSMKQRNAFVKGLLSYEEDVQHHAVISVENDTVSLVVWTKDLDAVTEMDFEYAKFADTHYKDVAYNVSDGNESGSAFSRRQSSRSPDERVFEELDEFH